MNEIECPRCKSCIDASGWDSEDRGETECDDCGFMFIVEIEYEPSYSSVCVEHEFGEWQDYESRTAGAVASRFCKHCGKCELR